MLLILIAPLPSFADKILRIHQYTTLTIGCNVDNGKDFIYTTKVLAYDQPIKLTFNCERPRADGDLQKDESISIRCLHDNPLTIPKIVKMRAGELLYVLCNVK